MACELRQDKQSHFHRATSKPVLNHKLEHFLRYPIDLPRLSSLR